MSESLFYRKRTGAYTVTGYVVLLLMIFLFSCQSGKEKEAHHRDAAQELPFPKVPDSLHTSDDSAKWFLEVGKQMIETKDYKNAKKSLQKAIDLKPLASDYYAAMGQLYLNETFRDSAYKYFSMALHLDSKNNQARLQKAFILWLKEDYHAALLQTDTLLKQKTYRSDALGIRSQIYEALGDTEKALNEMTKAIKITPDNYDAVMRMGDLLLEKKPEKALSFYKKASRLDTTAAEPYYCMGVIYAEEGNNERAEKVFNRSITLDAHYIPTYMHLGKLYEKEKDWEKAVEIYTLAVRMSPTNSKAFYKKGHAEEAMGNLKAAKTDYHQALVFDDKNRKAEKALERLSREQ